MKSSLTPVLVFIVAFTGLHACVNSGKKAVTTANEFEDLPLCSRLMYAATKQIVPVKELDPSFHSIARSDSQAMARALKVMREDTLSATGSCEVSSTQAFIKKPDECAGAWNGPYLEAALVTKYSSLTADEIQSFSDCGSSAR